MTPNQLSYSILKTIFILVLLALSLFILWEIRTIFVYLSVASVLALMGRPLVNVFNRRLKIPNTIGAILTLVIFLGVFAGLISLFISLVLDQPFKLNNIRSIDDLQESIKFQINQLSTYFVDSELSFLSDYVKETSQAFNLNKISGFFGNSISWIGGLFMDLFSVAFIAFFFLKDSDLLNNMILSVVPDNAEDKFIKALDVVKNLLSRYFIGLFLQMIIMFVIYLIILLSFGISNAPIIAIICASFNLIPYIGPLLGAITMGALSVSDLYAQNNFQLGANIVNTLIWIMVCYLLAQLWDNLVNQPQIYSKSVKSNPLEIFLVILIGGILFGVVGVIVAVPAYTVLRVFLKEFYSEFKVVKSITKNM